MARSSFFTSIRKNPARYSFDSGKMPSVTGLPSLSTRTNFESVGAARPHVPTNSPDFMSVCVKSPMNFWLASSTSLGQFMYWVYPSRGVFMISRYFIGIAPESCPCRVPFWARFVRWSDQTAGSRHSGSCGKRKASGPPRQAVGEYPVVRQLEKLNDQHPRQRDQDRRHRDRRSPGCLGVPSQIHECRDRSADDEAEEPGV